MKDTENHNPRKNKGLIALLVGMAAGFIFLISLWVGYSRDTDQSLILFLVPAFCSMLSAVLIFFDKPKKKSCTLTSPASERL